MGKKVKRAIIGTCVGAGIAGAIVAGLMIYKNAGKSPVNVYALTEMAMQDPESTGANVTQGNVTAEGIQKVYLSSSQTVADVKVHEGQEIKKGDVLFSYDTTLSGLDVDRANVKVGRMELELKKATDELNELYNMQPHSTQTIQPDHTVEYKPVETPRKLAGKGTMDDPYIYMISEGDTISGELLKKLLPAAEKTTAADAGNSGEESGIPDGEPAADKNGPDKSEIYIALITRENNALNAQITSKQGVRLEVRDGNITGMGIFEPFLPANIEAYEEQPQPYEVESGSEHTAEELAQLRASKEKEIIELKRNISLARNEYERLKLEAEDNAVRSTTDGVVSKVRSENEARDENSAFIEVNAGGGYFVTGTVNEFDRDKISVGQGVDVSVYTMDSGDGAFYTGEITEISDRPVQSDEEMDMYGFYGFGEGNTNTSYFPFKVKLEKDANLNENTYAEISYQTNEDSGMELFIPKAFVRTESGDSYVYVKGADGTLVRKSVKTGKDLWGEYTQIKSGINGDDMIAFPYGKNVFEGAKTKVSGIEELYEEAYSY